MWMIICAWGIHVICVQLVFTFSLWVLCYCSPEKHDNVVNRYMFTYVCMYMYVSIRARARTPHFKILAPLLSEASQSETFRVSGLGKPASWRLKKYQVRVAVKPGRADAAEEAWRDCLPCLEEAGPLLTSDPHSTLWSVLCLTQSLMILDHI